MKITVKNRNMSRVTASTIHKITAADEGYDDDIDGVMDAIDEVADNVQELQDSIDDIDEDSVDIAMNNNISNHYIAECDECQGVFISAVIQSDQSVDHVSGICPLCGKESDQYLKWVIKDAGTSEEV